MDKIVDLITTFLGNTNYINFFSILVVAFTSYQVAKYNASKPHKLKVKQMQLDNVYLPLYRISLKNSSIMSRQQAVEMQKEIEYILDKHYVLAYPQLHQLNSDLKIALELDSGYVQISKELFHQISVDYELLKKALGYPSENIFTIFVRMTNERKFKFILGYLNMFGFVCFFVFAVYVPTHNLSKEILLFISVFFITLFALNVFYLKEHPSKKRI